MTIPVAVIALLFARMEYRKYGKLTTIGVLLLCAMLIMPNLVLDFATRYKMPSTFLDYDHQIIQNKIAIEDIASWLESGMKKVAPGSLRDR